MAKLAATPKIPRGKPHYCDTAPASPVHRAYHAREYGFPLTGGLASEPALLERLALEIMQAGLSWEIVLKKRAAIARAFEGFRPHRVAGYGGRDIARLLADPEIIRNRLKIEAIVENAGRVLSLRQSHAEGFAGWLAAHHPLARPDWVRLFKKTFRFTGGEITGEFLMSIGYLPGAHRPECATARDIARLRPPWLDAEKAGFSYGITELA